jgi:hypothetical protein
MNIGRKVYFLNMYSITRQYGGPEEGGWYYDAYDCTYTSSGWDTDMVDEFIDVCHNNGISSPDLHHYYLLRMLQQHMYYQLGNLDRLGQGILVVIERAPAAQQTKERPHYE